MNKNILIALVFCNILWSAHPLMGKILLAEFDPMQTAWIRYTSAFFGYLIFMFFTERLQKNRSKGLRVFEFPKVPTHLALLLALGLFTFCFAPLILTQGLSISMATENALIVSMEPLMTAFFAWIFLKEKIAPITVLAFALAICGFYFLSGTGWGEIEELQSHLFGNILILLSLIGEALYTILGKKLIPRYSPFGVFGSALAIGVLGLTLVCAMNGNFLGIFDPGKWSLKVLLAILWIGPIGTAGGYLYVFTVLDRVSIIGMALLLFIQPLAGAVFGYLFLGDRLSAGQSLGSLLILLAVFLPYMVHFRTKRNVPHTN